MKLSDYIKSINRILIMGLIFIFVYINQVYCSEKKEIILKELIFGISFFTRLDACNDLLTQTMKELQDIEKLESKHDDISKYLKMRQKKLRHWEENFKGIKSDEINESMPGFVIQGSGIADLTPLPKPEIFVILSDGVFIFDLEGTLINIICEQKIRDYDFIDIDGDFIQEVALKFIRYEENLQQYISVIKIFKFRNENWNKIWESRFKESFYNGIQFYHSIKEQIHPWPCESDVHLIKNDENNFEFFLWEKQEFKLVKTDEPK